jgi:DNA-binding transcriptional MocR family regulator
MAGDTISFARGAPSADILPHEAVREAAARALASDWEKALSYGTGIGHPGLCEWIAERHGGIDASQVMVANGSLEGGAMLFEHLLEAGDRVIVERPTYDRTLLLLRRLGVELVPVPLEADGVDLGALEAALAEGPVKLAHIIPNAHNPAGCTLSSEKRVRLVELAAEHGFWIFEDDPYRELPFEGEPLETMLSLDQAGRVVHASSFSKTVSPGVRVGYLAGPATEIAKLAKRANETYISPNMLAESIVLELCRSGELDRNIAFVKGELKARCDALVAALREQIPEAEFVVPKGGYFLWLDLAEGTDTTALLAESRAAGATFVAGPDFMIEGGENSLRLSFAPVPADRAAEGVARIASALERLRSRAARPAHNGVLGRACAPHTSLPASLVCLVRRLWSHFDCDPAASSLA